MTRTAPPPPQAAADLPPILASVTTQLHHLQQQQHHHHHPRRAVDLRISAIEKYAYCLCLHVKPTTIFIAVFKLIRALLFASLLLNSEVVINEHGQEVSLSSLGDRYRTTDAAMGILSRFVMASAAAVGIYAVVSGRAALLMPLYAMLLCDFVFSLPAFYNRDIEFAADANSLSDLRQHSGGGLGVVGISGAAQTQHTRYSIILFSTVAMIVKIYFLCVVWKCYRYLRLSELISPIGLSDIYPHLPPAGYPVVRVLGSLDSTDLNGSQVGAGGAAAQGQNAAPPPYDIVASVTKPPNYEEAIKSSGQVFTIDSSRQANDQSQAQQTVVFAVPDDSTSVQVVTGGNSQPVSNVTPPRPANSTVEYEDFP